jgi:sugar (pentulose or hexulose) kinase
MNTWLAAGTFSGDYVEMLGATVGGDVSFTGGGACNRYWCQLRADVLRWPVRLPGVAEPAFGMAVLAASAGRPVCDVAKEMVRIAEVIDPRAERGSPAGALLAVCGRAGVPWLAQTADG